MSEQQNWRWCNKCKSIHHALEAGSCASGGTHDASTSIWYAIPTAAPSGVGSQPGWRKCNKCKVLFYVINAGNACATGGEHDATGSLEYLLGHTTYPANGGQGTWYWCSKCQQICNGYLGAGKCPKGGDHTVNLAVEYHMKLGYPDPPQITWTYGNASGGFSFNDSAVIAPSANTGPIRQIFIRAGATIDSIGLGYANGTRYMHGASTGGTLHTIDLADDEVITGVNGRAGTLLDQISFITNKRTIGPYGSSEGGQPFSENFFNCALQYLFGRANVLVDQIGFGYGKPLVYSTPTSTPTPTSSITRSLPVGGTGGTPFDDIATGNTLLGKIKRISVRCDDKFVYNITTQFKSGEKLPHGGGAGTEVVFDLENDEWITEVSGRAGTSLDAIQFVLSSGRRSPLYGGTGGAPFTMSKDKNVVAGFYGRAGTGIDQFGVCFDTMKPWKVTIKSLDFDLNSFTLTETPKALTSSVVINNTSSTQTTSSTLTDEVSESETNSVTITHGLSVEIAYEAEVSAGVVTTTKSVKFGYSFQHAKTTETSLTKTRTISHQVSMEVPANSSLKATAMVTEGTYDVPWTAQGVVSYNDGTQSAVVTLTGTLTGVQCYGQAVQYDNYTPETA